MDKKSKFTPLVLFQAEDLSAKAQAALRRNMEKHTDRIRIIMVCESLERLIPAIKSRCLLIRVKSPTDEEIVRVLEKISHAEKLSDSRLLSQISQIPKTTNNNLRSSILLFQVKILKKENTNDSVVWKEVVRNQIVNELRDKQDINAIKKIRTVLYDMIANSVKEEDIIHEITIQALPLIQLESLRTKLKETAAMIDAQMKQGNKTIIFLESFVVKLALIIKEDK